MRTPIRPRFSTHRPHLAWLENLLEMAINADLYALTTEEIDTLGAALHEMLDAAEG